MFLHPVNDGLSFVEACGTIWDARLTRASIGGLDAGDLGVRVSPLEVLLGRVVADIDLDGKDIAGEARLQMGLLGGERRITAQQLRIAGLPLQGDMKLPGQTTIRNLDMVLEDQACRSGA